MKDSDGNGWVWWTIVIVASILLFFWAEENTWNYVLQEVIPMGH